MMEYFKEDIKRYFTVSEIAHGISGWKMIKKVLLTEPLWMILLYRYGRWLHMCINIKIVRFFLKIPYCFFARVLEILLGISIPWNADIGKGFYIGHYGGIWIGPVKMGEKCNISQEVTIGLGGTGDNRGIPEIGDRVWIGPGAKIFGKIRIGNGVAIGANAVVSKNLPDNALVVGNPPRIINYEGSAGLLDIQAE